MKKLIATILLLAIATAHLAAYSLVFGRGTASSGSCGPNTVASPLLSEQWEGTGLGSWSSSAPASTDSDNTTAPVLEGVQQLRVVRSTTDTPYVTKSITSSSEVWLYFKFRFTTLPAAGQYVYIGTLMFDTSTPTVGFSIDENGRLAFYNTTSTASGTTTAGMSVNTTYHVWIHYKKGTGANGATDVGFSTDGTVPTSGSNFIQATGTTDVNNITQVRLGFWFGSNSAAYTAYYDQVLCDDAAILCNPTP